jgi:hypothetical protein
MKSGNLNFLEPSGPLQACNGTALPFFNAKCTALTQQRNHESIRAYVHDTHDQVNGLPDGGTFTETAVLDDDDKIPTPDMWRAEQLLPFMSTRQGVGRQRNRGSILGKDKTYIFSPKGQTGPAIYSACQQVRETLSWSYSGRELKLNTHLHLVSRLRMNGAIPTFLHMLSRGAQS